MANVALPNKSVDASPTYFYSESSGGAVVKTLVSAYATLDGSQTLTSKTLTSPNLDSPTIRNGFTEETVAANTSTAYTISLANGSVQVLTLTGNCTYTFPTATAGQSFQLIQKQDATGSRTVTWPAAVKWPASTNPTLTSTANKADMFKFVSDGTWWYGEIVGQNYL